MNFTFKTLSHVEIPAYSSQQLFSKPVTLFCSNNYFNLEHQKKSYEKVILIIKNYSII